ncbi:MAG: N-acetylmuramoyl-L-alanine amidase [Oscillospiraceae bacterium]|nr:N-acetylmuramoyl-L-alanine amidase [Oscillospiraceae bacterium]MBQ8996385.1 N-acetylmuramoyl-L-alanine amidase [Oscillospiraceae bacterium]
MSNSPLVDYIRISPHKSPRVYPITKITIHHMAGRLTVEQCGELFQTRQAASNYGIDNSLRVGMYAEEDYRAWCSADYDNDHRAINIEVANDGGEPDWHVSDAVLHKLVDLCVDICQRNNIPRLNFTGDATGNLTQHNYFVATACPGNYMKSKFPWIAAEVNRRLEEEDKMLYKLIIGFASKGDIKTFERLLESLGVEYQEENGYISTGVCTANQKATIEAKATDLIVPCVVVEVIEPEDNSEILNQVLKALKETQEELENLKKQVAIYAEDLAELAR